MNDDVEKFIDILLSVNDTEKYCGKCKIVKSINEFTKLHEKRHSWCKKCLYKYVNAYKKKNKRKVKFYNVKAKYGIDEKTYEEWLRVQNYKCGICKNNLTNKNTSLDHCHDTLSIRGFLCNKCNSNLGWYESRRKDIKLWLAKLPLGTARS